MHAEKYFPKRSYTFQSFVRDLTNVFRTLKYARSAMTSDEISPEFREKILLTVTAVNGCKYCMWGHSIIALKVGLTSEEITALTKNDFTSCSEDQVLALTFARHYAETEANPTCDAAKNLVKKYGKTTSQELFCLINAMTLANLLGNTHDAFLSRFKGMPPENGSFIFESIVFVLAHPFLGRLKHLFLKLIQSLTK